MLPVIHGVVSTDNAPSVLGRIIATASPIDFISLSTITVDSDSFSIDWGDGNYINYVANTSASAIPSGNITVRTLGLPQSIRFNTDTYTDINLIDASSFTRANLMCINLFSLLTFNASNTGFITDFTNAWRSCVSLTSFPLIDTTSARTLQSAWRNCNKLTNFPLINTSAVQTFTEAWYLCTSLTNLPLIDTSTGVNFVSTFGGCTALECLSGINTLLKNNTTDLFLNTPLLTAPNAAEQTAILAGSNYVNAGDCPAPLPAFSADMVATAVGATVSFLIQGNQFDDYIVDWGDGVLQTYNDPNGFNFVISSSVVGTTNVSITSNGTPTRFQITTDTITSLDLKSITTINRFRELCRNITNLTSFTTVDTGLVTDFLNAWSGCSGLTNFPELNYSNVSTFVTPWFGCTGIVNMIISGQFGNGGAVDMTGAFSGMTSVQSIQLPDTSNATLFANLFKDCINLSCISAVNTLSQTTTTDMFLNTPALTDPTAAEQTAILGGSNYVNANACP